MTAPRLLQRRPATLTPQALAQRLSGTPLLLMLDIDGTLCDIVSEPGAARVPDATLRTLARLAAMPDVHVVLITGRAVRDARVVVGALPVPIVGNHGLEWLDAAGKPHPIEGWDELAPAVRKAREELAAHLAQVDGAMLEDKTFSLSVHHRHVERARVESLIEDVTRIAHRSGLRVERGRAIVNVLPPIDVDKGDAAMRIARETGALADTASVLFAGDDATDEHAFRALGAAVPGAVTVHVGDDDRPTLARFRIASPALLARALEHLANRDA